MGEYKPPFHLTEEIMSLAMEIGESIGAIMVDSTMSPDPKLRRESCVHSIYSSLAIEQNTLSLDQVTAVIDGKRILGPPKDIQEVKNAYEAYEHMSSYDPCSMEDLLTVHRYMMKELVPEAGCFRSGNVGVFHGDQLVHAGTPAKFVPEVMSQLFDWLRTTSMHPLIKSCVFHYEFEFIHPFSDGNGRTGRLWHSLILQRWKPIFLWLPIESLIQEKQEGYYKALNESNSLNECTPFVTFMLEVIRDALAEIIQNQKAFIPTNDAKNVGRNAADNVGINQDVVMRILKKQPHTTAKSLAEAMNLSPRQVERVLAELKKEGKIVRRGSNKSGCWEVMNADQGKMIIRQAAEEDAWQIADILVEDWKKAYRGIIDSDYLDSMSVEERYQRELQRYQIYRVAAVEKEILGFTWNEMTDDEDADCEIIAIYIRHSKRKGGIGKTLFKDSVDLFRTAGRKRMIIWCLRENEEARKFYEKMGGTVYKTGTHRWGSREYDMISYLYQLDEAPWNRQKISRYTVEDSDRVTAMYLNANVE